MTTTAFSSPAMGGPRLNGFSDQYGAQTFTAAQVNNLFRYFGNPGIAVSDTKQYTAPELAAWYSDKPSIELAQISTAAIVDGNGWPFKLAPPRQANMKSQINVLEIDEFIAKQAPEGAPYEETSFSQREVYSVLKLNKLGGKMPMAFFAFGGADADRVMAQQSRQISNAFWKSARLQIATAVVTVRDVHRESASKNASFARNFLEATRIERDDFAIFQTNSNALPQLHHTSVAILGSANRRPNMAVVPPGVLDQLALTPKNTEASAVGTEKANANVVRAGREITNLFEGLTIFEDEAVSAINTRLTDYTVFQMPIQVGEYNFIGPRSSDASADADSNSLTIQIYSHAKWGWETIGIRDVIEKNLDLRWDESGALAPEHGEIAKRMEEVMKQKNLNSVGTNIDPMIWYSEQAANAGASNGGFFVAEHWGEVNLEYLSNMRVFGIARSIFRRVSQEMEPNDIKNIIALQKIASDLQTPPNIDDPTLQAFNAAISIQNNNSKGSVYLAANEYGVPNVPTMAAGGMSVVYSGGRRYITQLESADPTKRLFAVDVARGNVASYPARPYGYGTLPGLRYIASLRNGLDDMGLGNWKRDADNIAQYLDSVDRFCAKFSAYFPRTPLSDITKMPDYLRSGNSRWDQNTMIWSSVIDKSHHPYMVRTPLYNKNRAGEDYVGSIHYSGQKPANGFESDAQTGPLLKGTLRNDVNLQQVGIDGDEYAEDTAGETLVAADKQVVDLISNSRFPAGWRGAFSNALDYDAINGSAFRRTSKYLLPLIREIHGNVGDLQNAKFYLVQLISAVGQVGLEGAVNSKENRNLQASALQALNSAYLGKVVTVRDLKEMMRSTVIGQAGPIPMPADEVAPTGGAITKVDNPANQWKSSRLVYKPTAWQDTFKYRKWEDFEANLTRPSNPQNPLSPLAGSYYVANADDAENSKNTIDSFAKSHRAFEAESGIFRMFNGFNDSWINTPAGRAFVDRERELLDPQTWHDSAGAIFSDELAQLVGWATALSTTSSGAEIPRLINRPHLRARLEDLELRLTDEPVKWFARALLLSEVHKDNVMALLDHNIAPLYSSYLFLRPFEAVVGALAIWALGGENTARLNWGYAQAVIALNTIHEMWNFHYNVWMDAIIIDDAAILLRYNVVVQGYIGGRDLIPFVDPKAFANMPTVSSLNASMFVVCLGGEITRNNLPDCINISGAVEPLDFPYASFRDVDKLFDQTKLQLPMGYAITRFGLHLINEGRTRVDAFIPEARKRSNRFNELCWAGPQKNWNRAQQKYEDNIPGNSHWSKFGTHENLDLSGICRGQIMNSPMIKSMQYVN